MDVQECLVIIDQLAGDCHKCSRVLVPKLRKLQAENAAHLLLELVVDYDMEELVSEILNKLDKCPGTFFETIVDYDSKLSELYNN